MRNNEETQEIIISAKFRCHKSRSHTEWASPPQSRSPLDLTVNPPCGFSRVQGKGLGRNTGGEATTTAGRECGSSLATRPIALLTLGRRKSGPL